MVMMGDEFLDEEPFTEVYIHSVIQAPDGRRMSKSLGTGIDPLEVIEQHGADALRFGLLDDVEHPGRALLRRPHRPGPPARHQALERRHGSSIDRGGRAGVAGAGARTLADRGSRRASPAVDEAADLTARFDCPSSRSSTYELVFDDYCDWYLELLKAGEATPDVAGFALEQILALVHPLMPFVTEECWSRVPGAEGLLAVHRPAGCAGRGRPGRRGRDARPCRRS